MSVQPSNVLIKFFELSQSHVFMEIDDIVNKRETACLVNTKEKNRYFEVIKSLYLVFKTSSYWERILLVPEITVQTPIFSE